MTSLNLYWCTVLSLRRYLRGIPASQIRNLDKPVVEENTEVPPPPTPNSLQRSFTLKLDAAVEESLSSEKTKAKHHPGLRGKKTITVSDEIQTAVFALIGKYKLEDIKRASKEFAQYVKSRLPPADTSELRTKAYTLEEKLRSKIDIGSENPTREEVVMYEETIKRKLYAHLRRSFYHWKPVEYDAYNSLLYMFSRFPAEYAVLTKIFQEISAKDENFRPEYLLDFGSGLCSVLWATKAVWNDAVHVALCVDASQDMQKISKLLMKGGKATGKSTFNGVFLKSVIPHGEDNKYDLVTSAYSLLEIESQDDRVKLYTSLLSKSRKYIVIVEHATTGGFKLIMEARNFFLSQDGVRILAPCPHALACPRLASKELSPICSFGAQYMNFRLVTQKHDQATEHYSYLVIEKLATDAEKNNKSVQNDWPRVLHSAPRPRHVHVHACLPDGNIKQIAITPNKNGKHLYKCASYCKSGDLLPCTQEFVDDDAEKTKTEK